ncbi:MAG: competence/damage-inducible protein A [bacterium]|nr:competence/damage-inducible protein A [bacterium]
MRAEILAIGTELLLGQIANENARHLSRVLAELGVDVFYHVTVGDNPGRIDGALKAALERSDLVLITGGLGPTADDITRERVAAVTGRPLHLHPPSLQAIEAVFARTGRPMAASNRKQALLPEGALALPNPVGTAPGAVLDIGRATVVMLPGPPAELTPMVHDHLVPYLEGRLRVGGELKIITSRVLKLAGIGESTAEARIADLIAAQGNPTIAPLAGQAGEVSIRITAKAAGRAEAVALIEPVEAAIRARLGSHIYGTDDDTLAAVVARALARRGSTLAVAESCTGGLLGHLLTSLPGSSAFFERGLVVYSNRSKVEHCGVDPLLLERHGAVSAEVAAALAEGVRRLAATDFSLAVTGIAGPGGGSTDKPVGLVFAGLAGGGATLAAGRRLPGDRGTVKRRACLFALELLWQRLEGHGGTGPGSSNPHP